MIVIIGPIGELKLSVRNSSFIFHFHLIANIST